MATGDPAPPLPPPRLHVIVTDKVAARTDLPARAAALQRRCGPDLALHLRLREATGREVFHLAERLVEGSVRHGGWTVVNERLDVALAAGAQALQLGTDALPVRWARQVAGGRVRLGASVHGPEAALAAHRDGADFLVLGTIFATPTHPGAEPGGTALVEACRGVGLPILAIGGVDACRVREVLAAGAYGVAVVRAVWEAADPTAAAAELVAAIEAGGRG